MSKKNLLSIDIHLENKIRNYITELKNKNKLKGMYNVGFEIRSASSSSIYLRIMHINNDSVRPMTLRISNHYSKSNIRDQYISLD